MAEDRRKLSDSDIQAFIEALNENQSHCRFKNIDSHELVEAVIFYRNINAAINDSKKTVRNTLIKLVLAAVIGLILLGAGVKMKQMIQP